MAGSSSRNDPQRMILMKIASAGGCNADGTKTTMLTFNVGDRVRVNVQSEDELRSLQEGHGGWNQRMARFIGRVGTIHRTTENGDLRVRFEDSQIRWTFNPVALAKFPVVGDTVRVLDDMDRVKQLQVNHGEWVDSMREALGKKGKVTVIYRDNDLRVQMCGSEDGRPGNTFTLNPNCVVLVPNDSSSNPNSTSNASSDILSQQQHQQQRVCGSAVVADDVISHRHQHGHHHSAPTAATVTTASPPVLSSNSSGILMTRASGSEGVNGEEVINRSSGGTAEITDLLRQVQLRDTKFKCSRSDGPAAAGAGAGGSGSGIPHPVDAASVSQQQSSSLSACPDGHPHHAHHHHAMHRSPASSSSSRHSSHSSPLMATTQAMTAAAQQQQQFSSPAARPPHVVPDVMSFPGSSDPTSGVETVEMLKDKIRAIEDIIMCNICMESIKNVAFLCGHGSCSTCAQSLRSCHMCRLPITQRINLY
jgi:hypothetical protein